MTTITTSTPMVIIALVAALALLGVVVVTVALTIPLQQQAEARGCVNPNAPGGGSIAVNASKGRCVK
jgi:hypothetical protein